MILVIRAGKVTVYPGFLLLFAVFYFFDPGWLIPAAAVSVTIHELGHIATLFIMGIPINAVNLSMTGIAIKIDGRLIGYRGEIIAALSGPCASIILSLGATYAARAVNCEFLYILSGMSAVHGIFNLLPIRPLDGGRAAQAILYSVFGRRYGERSLKLAESALIFLLTAAGFWLYFFRVQNITFLIIPLWISFYYCKQNMNSVEF